MIKNKQTLIILAILGLIIIVLGVATALVVRNQRQQVDEATKQIFTGSHTNQPTYVDLLGNKISLEDYLGEIIVVVSWASWSPFSATDLVAVDQLAADYVGKKVKFIAINRKESKEQATRFINTLPPLNNLVVAIDTEDLFYLAVGGYAMPESVIFDQKGVKAKHIRGVVPVVEVKTTIDALLEDE